MTKPPLEDTRVPVRIKLAALWTSTMFCYVYGDIFFLYQTGHVQQMLEGKMPPLGTVTPTMLLCTSISMAIPACMIFLSLALRPKASRWLNIIVGFLYSAFVAVTMPGAWSFYIFFGSVDVLLTLLVVWYAWRWPRERAA